MNMNTRADGGRSAFNAGVYAVDDGTLPSGNAVLDALDPQDRRAIWEASRPFSLPRDATLRKEDEVPEEVHLPTRGVLAALWVTETGRTVATGLIGRNGMTPLHTEAERSPAGRRVIALTEVKGRRISLPRLRALMEDRPGLRNVLQIYAAKVIHQADARLASAMFDDAERRLAHILVQLVDLLASERLYLTQEMLAGLLGSQRSTINEAAQRLVKMGILRCSRGSITVLSKDGLERAAQGVRPEPGPPAAGF